MEQYKVLFVCTGNICRSPTAEAVFRHKVQEAGLTARLTHDSAGTHGYHVGEPADRRAIDYAAGRGVAMDDLRARKLERHDFDSFDLLLAMDKGHQNFMRTMASDADGKIRLFMSYAPDTGYDEVPDPYYGGAADFELAYNLIEQSVESLLQCLHREQKL